jgi:hypothetical protein
MKILSLDPLKNNTKSSVEKRDVLDGAMEALSSALSQTLPEKHSFEEFERVLLELCNEASRRILSRRLEELSKKFNAHYLLVGGDQYKRHALGAVEYHSLCGSMKIERYTYRDTAVRNGPTVVPMELAAGLVERATPALAFRAALGDAQCPGRQWEEQLRASHRQPPSRSTLERLAKRIGETVKEAAPKILPVVREKEKMHKDAFSVSIGLDRTTIPMEEKVNKYSYARDPGDRRRKKPYVRRPPDPVVVNYRMGYVGTVSLIGIDGESIQTHKYGCSADVDPCQILKNMTDDLVHIQSKREASGLPQLPMGIIQDGAPEMWNLVEPAVTGALPGKRYEKCIDRFHLMERLAESLKALRDPMLHRETQLNDWREALEKDDKAIDKIERFIIRNRNRLRKNNRLSAANAEILRSHLVYIKNNKRYMRYASLRQKGLPTGSGATEGACKSLIMTRTKGCGQRWHSRGVNSVLSLRSLYMSERLVPFWDAMSVEREVEIREAA